jgi:hypothetical protein
MKLKTPLKAIILILILLTPNLYLVSSTKAENNNYSSLDNYVEYFYNRYSQHFDQNGLVYSIPEYGIEKLTEPQKIREWISLISYYKYRALDGDQSAQNIIRFGILKGYNELLKRGSRSQSFQEAEAHFLTIQILEKLPHLLSEKIKQNIYNVINNYLEEGIKALDTENRAIIAGTHWQYINNHLFKKRIINFNKKEYFDNLIKNKIDSAIQESINSDHWYLENNLNDFSVHYHAVSAFMLTIYGELSEETKYLNTAQRMYNNLQKITLANGEIPAEIGHRPSALGAQFYLMTGLLGYYFNDHNYMNYLSFAEGNRFFQDPNYPHRLEFHSDNIFNDDYAFSDIAELGSTISKLQNVPLYYKIVLPPLEQKYLDHTFYIRNTGNEIIFENLQINN